MILVHQQVCNVCLVIIENAAYGNNAVDILICFQNDARKKRIVVEFGRFFSDYSSQLLVITVYPAFHIFFQNKRR